MKRLMFMLIFCAGFLASCAHTERDVGHGETSVLRGTGTAVVEVSLDADGMPSVNIDKVVVNEGQRIVWVGPKDMLVRFPESSPFKERRLETKNAVVNVIVPEQSWKDKEKVKRFKYDVVVNGKVLDPFIILRRNF